MHGPLNYHVDTMLPSERLELAIYKTINRGPGPVTLDISLPMLSQLTGISDHAAIVDRLKDLQDENRVLLSKWSGGQRWPRADSPDRTFFYTGSFLVEIAPRGRKYFEELEQRAELEAKNVTVTAVPPKEATIFVSCGQSTPAERELGKEIARLVEQKTDYAAYFAENQSTLEGVTENILKRLHDAVGFIAIMHPRGNVSNPNNPEGLPRVRGSVWVEQEIAIAAFISQALQRALRVRVFVHESIEREGLRDKLHLNPTLFRKDSEVLEDLISQLPSWRDMKKQPSSEFELKHRQLAESKLNALSEAGKDLVHFLLHHGRTEANDLIAQFKHRPEYGEAIQQARGEGLVKDSATENPARPGTLYFWEINPVFEGALRDLLGRR
jgi:hypothetical protein